jgi:hypothetical protein
MFLINKRKGRKKVAYHFDRVGTFWRRELHSPNLCNSLICNLGPLLLCDRENVFYFRFLKVVLILLANKDILDS